MDDLQKFSINIKNVFNKRQEQESLGFFCSDERFCKGKIILVIAINVLILEQWRRKEIFIFERPLLWLMTKYSSPKFSNAVSPRVYLYY